MLVDGKADNKLYGEVLALARRFGREDDVLCLNFMVASGVKDSETGSSSTTMTWVAPRGAHALMRMAVEVFSLNDKAVDAPARIVGERPIAALRSGRDVSAARPSRSEPFVPCPVQAACRKAPATNVDLRLKAGIGPTNALERALGHAGLRPARRLPWRIRRWRFKGLTGGDRTGCAACWRRRGAVVAEPRLDFVGLAPRRGTTGLRAVRSPRMEPSIPVGVDDLGHGGPASAF